MVDALHGATPTKRGRRGSAQCADAVVGALVALAVVGGAVVVGWTLTVVGGCVVGAVGFIVVGADFAVAVGGAVVPGWALGVLGGP